MKATDPELTTPGSEKSRKRYISCCFRNHIHFSVKLEFPLRLPAVMVAVYFLERSRSVIVREYVKRNARGNAIVTVSFVRRDEIEEGIEAALLEESDTANLIGNRPLTESQSNSIHQHQRWKRTTTRTCRRTPWPLKWLPSLKS